MSLRRSYRGSAIPKHLTHRFQKRKQFRGGSHFMRLRPAGWLERLTGPCRQLMPPTRPPVYGRPCSSSGLLQPKSAITTRPNHTLPRQDLHLQACQRSKAAHRWHECWRMRNRVATPTSDMPTQTSSTAQAGGAQVASDLNTTPRVEGGSPPWRQIKLGLDVVHGAELMVVRMVDGRSLSPRRKCEEFASSSRERVISSRFPRPHLRCSPPAYTIRNARTGQP